MSRTFLIERVRRDASGRITRVGWSERKPTAECLEVGVTMVVAAIRDGARVYVVVGGIIGQAVQISPDGTTIVDPVGDSQKPFQLGDLPLF